MGGGGEKRFRGVSSLQLFRRGRSDEISAQKNVGQPLVQRGSDERCDTQTKRINNESLSPEAK